MPGKTIIGKTIIIEGEIEGAEDLVVQGTVKGSIVLKENLSVEPSGLVEADVQTQNVDVAGEIKGDITATNKVEIKKEGKMIGDIRAPRILIADGALFKGSVDMERR